MHTYSGPSSEGDLAHDLAQTESQLLRHHADLVQLQKSLAAPFDESKLGRLAEEMKRERERAIVEAEEFLGSRKDRIALVR
jgi:hypothetical protein